MTARAHTTSTSTAPCPAAGAGFLCVPDCPAWDMGLAREMPLVPSCSLRKQVLSGAAASWVNPAARDERCHVCLFPSDLEETAKKGVKGNIKNHFFVILTRSPLPQLPPSLLALSCSPGRVLGAGWAALGWSTGCATGHNWEKLLDMKLSALGLCYVQS